MEFHEGGFAFGIDQLKSVNAETLDRPKERGMARSDIAHISMWVDSGISDAQSQKVSCALPACGKARSDSIFTA